MATDTLRKGIKKYNSRITEHRSSVEEAIHFEQAADLASAIYHGISVIEVKVILISDFYRSM